MNVQEKQMKLRQLIAAGKVKRSDFSIDISSKDLRSEKQLYWLDKLINDAEVQSTPAAQLEMAGIVTLFATAQQHLKRPKIRLRITTAANEDRDLVLTMKAQDIMVYGVFGEGRTYGRITPDGAFIPGKSCTDDVKQTLINLLTDFAANPAEVAQKFGQVMKFCCFCQLALTDDRSLLVGYGPVCADHWGLPWGNK